MLSPDVIKTLILLDAQEVTEFFNSLSLIEGTFRANEITGLYTDLRNALCRALKRNVVPIAHRIVQSGQTFAALHDQAITVWHGKGRVVSHFQTPSLSAPWGFGINDSSLCVTSGTRAYLFSHEGTERTSIALGFIPRGCVMTDQYVGWIDNEFYLYIKHF